MYKLNYYSNQPESLTSKEQNYKYLGMGEFFRRKKDALHYLFGKVQNEYRNEGYTTEPGPSSLYCYKNNKTDQGNLMIMKILIKVEK